MRINQEISMGEAGLIYYETILDKNIMNKIIISTILDLLLKKHIKFEQNSKKEIIIKIVNSNEKLRKSEEFILECLKKSDIEKDNELKLEEITRVDNTIFLKNKKKISELIIKEALEEQYIDKEKIEMKKKYLRDSISKIIITFFVIFLILNIFRYISFVVTPNTEKMILIVVLIAAIVIHTLSYKKLKKKDIYTEKTKEEKENMIELKKYLENYSLIKNRELIEIYLWEKYLAYSVILDINQNIIDILKINLDKDVDENDEIVKNIQFDFYENQYFYIDKNNQKRYITKQEKILLQKMIDKKNSKWFL